MIYNLPLQDNEDPINVARIAGQIVDVDIKKEDIDAAHRHNSRKETPSFIVCLVSGLKRDETIKSARSIKKMRYCTLRKGDGWD